MACFYILIPAILKGYSQRQIVVWPDLTHGDLALHHSNYRKIGQWNKNVWGTMLQWHRNDAKCDLMYDFEINS